MNIHLLCAFYRNYIYKTLIKYYEPENIIFHPICDEKDVEPFKNNDIPSWVQPFICPPLKIPGDQVYKKFDYFLDGHEIIEEDFYGFIDDDSMFEPGFFNELRKYKDFDVVYNSNYRGDRIPRDGSVGHDCTPLMIRSPKDIYPDHIGLAMYFVKGKLLKDIRFGNDWSGNDGLFAMKLLKLTNNIGFMTNWFVLGNYFQPGRNTDSAYFLKDNWIMPSIVPTEYPINWSMTYKRKKI